MKNFIKKIPIIIAFVLIAVLAIYFFTKDSNEFVAINELYVQQDTVEENTEIETIIIHVAGEVNNPGIVTIPSGSRISDAIESAGGLTSLADVSKVNLAYILRRWAENLYPQHL